MSVWHTDPAAMNSQYKMPTVFEVLVEYTQQHRNEFDQVSWTREKKIVHILAKSAAMAVATWEFDNLYPGQMPEHTPTLLSIRPLCTINLFCDITHWRSF